MSVETEVEEDAEMQSRVRRGALWGGLSSLVLRFANIAITAVIVRIVSPHDFGVFAAALTVYAVVSNISELGVASVLTRRDTDADAIAPTVATIAMFSCSAIAAGMFFGAPWLASALGAPDASSSIRVLSLTVVLVGVFTVPGAMLAREFRQNVIFKASIISFVPSNALLILLALHGDGALSFAWSRVVGQLIMGIVMVIYVSKRYRFGFDRSQVRMVLTFGLPLAGANLVGYTLLNADYAFVGHLLGPIALAAYVLAFNVANWSSALLGSMVNSVAMPAFSRFAGDIRRMSSAMSSAHRLIAVVAWPVCAITIASAHPLIEVLYGRKWLAAAPVLALLAVYGAMFIHSLVFANLLGGSGHTTALLIVQVIWIAALIPAMALGIHLDGLRGVAIAHVLVIAIVVLPTYMIATRRILGIKSIAAVRVVVPFVFAAAGAYLVDRAVTSVLHQPVLQLLVGAAAGGVAYILLTAIELHSLVGGMGGGSIGKRILRVLEVAAVPRALLRPAPSTGRHSISRLETK
ncbi:PST family polysaccharide transporter [Jatrophihabitans sp. GAS493]|uniref:oligosaccharide flippase family protein n=1 Tax=Jatrophihabitans sp. GAS493 TaxID=1907575 RepID=UPI000BB88D70|nr:oligosaccharide flippase family protein [Jatrophihabitans sp. GAS493]SOD70308.1 PST family polysaccharide transporter [Jatrophihabitans sp. GAS493]